MLSVSDQILAQKKDKKKPANTGRFNQVSVLSRDF